MDFLLFTYPNCQKCEDMKAFLKTAAITAREYKVEQKEGRLKIRDFLGQIKRDEKGSIVLPTLILHDNGHVAAVMNTRQEVQEWLKSRG
jgi:glutaredoxin